MGSQTFDWTISSGLPSETISTPLCLGPPALSAASICIPCVVPRRVRQKELFQVLKASAAFQVGKRCATKVGQPFLAVRGKTGSNIKPGNRAVIFYTIACESCSQRRAAFYLNETVLIRGRPLKRQVFSANVPASSVM